LPWHRNGCCMMKPRGQKSYCIWGEGGPSPFPGLGISYTTNIDEVSPENRRSFFIPTCVILGRASSRRLPGVLQVASTVR
jgi:hypothetical protein